MTDVKVTAVVGTGGSTTAIKVYESEEACRNGAQEIDMFINPGKLLSGDWTYVEQEIAVIAAITNYYKSVLTVSVDHDLLNNDQHKIKFYQLCSGALVLAHSIEAEQPITKVFPVGAFKEFNYLPEQLALYNYTGNPVIAEQNKPLRFHTKMKNAQSGLQEDIELVPMSETILRQLTFKNDTIR